MRTVILSARNSSVLRRTKVRLSANNARRKSCCQQTAGGGEGGGQESYGSHLVSLPLALPRLPPKGYMRLLVLTVDDEMTRQVWSRSVSYTRTQAEALSLMKPLQRSSKTWLDLYTDGCDSSIFSTLTSVMKRHEIITPILYMRT